MGYILRIYFCLLSPNTNQSSFAKCVRISLDFFLLFVAKEKSFPLCSLRERYNNLGLDDDDDKVKTIWLPPPSEKGNFFLSFFPSEKWSTPDKTSLSQSSLQPFACRRHKREREKSQSRLGANSRFSAAAKNSFSLSLAITSLDLRLSGGKKEKYLRGSPTDKKGPPKNKYKTSQFHFWTKQLTVCYAMLHIIAVRSFQSFSS